MNIRQEAQGSGNIQVAIENFNQNVGKLPSLIGKVLPRIAEIVSNGNATSSDTNPYEIDSKIEYNNVTSFKEIIDNYGGYGVKIDELYDERNNFEPGFRKKVLSYFGNKYMLKKERLVHTAGSGSSPIDTIKKSADDIIRDIFDEFKSDLVKSKNLDISMEEVETCALVVVCHAFIECKILEKPPSDN